MIRPMPRKPNETFFKSILPKLQKARINITYYGEEDQDFMKQWIADLRERNKGMAFDLEPDLLTEFT